MSTMSASAPITLQVIPEQVPSQIYTYTPEECTLILQMGSILIESFKTNKLQVDPTHQIQLLTQELENQRNSFKFAMDECKTLVSEQYKERLDHKDEYIQELREQLAEKAEIILEQKKAIVSESKKLYETESSHKVQLFQDSLCKFDQQLTKFQDLYNAHTKQRSMLEIGDEGESIYHDLAMESFRFFEKFDIVNVASEAAKGDFHMFFQDFNVLVDVKNWDNMVTNGERDKLQRDLLANNNMMFGWMVSLKTNIRKFDNFPISVEWVRHDKCILYINSLMKQRDPIEFLRLAWNFCSMMYHLNAKNAASEEVKEEELTSIYSHIKQLEGIFGEETSLIQGMVKSMDELNKNAADIGQNIDRLKTNNKMVKDFIRDHLNDKSNRVLSNMSCKKLGRKPRASNKGGSTATNAEVVSEDS
jgi:vacuolar-type H+-ATPase subunit H